MNSIFQILAIVMALLALAVVFGQSRNGLNRWSLCACLLLPRAAGRLRPAEPAAAVQITNSTRPPGYLPKSLIPLCWLGYAMSLQRRQTFRAFPWFAQLLIGIAALLPLLVLHLRFQGFFFSPDFGEEKILFVEPVGFYFYLALIAYQAMVLYYLEQALVSATPIARRQFLHELLGGLLIIAVIIFYQSQALLHRTIDMNLMPARSLAVAVGAAMIGYSRFRRQQGLNMQFSQHVAFRSAALLAIGLYLVRAWCDRGGVALPWPARPPPGLCGDRRADRHPACSSSSPPKKIAEDSKSYSTSTSTGKSTIIARSGSSSPTASLRPRALAPCRKRSWRPIAKPLPGPAPPCICTTRMANATDRVATLGMSTRRRAHLRRTRR